MNAFTLRSQTLQIGSIPRDVMAPAKVAVPRLRILWEDIGNLTAEAVGAHGKIGDRFLVLREDLVADFLNLAKFVSPFSLCCKRAQNMAIS